MYALKPFIFTTLAPIMPDQGQQQSSTYSPLRSTAGTLPRLPPLDPALARSLLRCPLPLPSPKPFYYPTLHSLGVIGKASEWEHSARGIKGSPPVPGDQ